MKSYWVLTGDYKILYVNQPHMIEDYIVLNDGSGITLINHDSGKQINLNFTHRGVGFISSRKLEKKPNEKVFLTFKKYVLFGDLIGVWEPLKNIVLVSKSKRKLKKIRRVIEEEYLIK